jgi:hypothetical protein
MIMTVIKSDLEMTIDQRLFQATSYYAIHVFGVLRGLE